MYSVHWMEKFVSHLVDFDISIAALSYALVPIGAYIAFCQHRVTQNLGSGSVAFIRYCFALHPSTSLSLASVKMDIGFVILKKFVTNLVLVPQLVSSVFAAHVSYTILVSYFGLRGQTAPGLWLSVFIIAICILLQDFVEFIVHYGHHKIKVLWSVHKVHHSSEFLMLALSVKRTHVLEEVIAFSLNSATLGMAIGVMSYAFSLSIQKSEIFGVDAWFFLQLFSFWHLRHSHISLSYGWLERFLQSPAQHQLHHSFEQRHWDKNFGLLFSVWDRMFGCFLRSVDPSSFRIGLPEADRHDYDTVVKLYVTPFRKIWDAARKSADQPRSVSTMLTSAEPMKRKVALTS